MIDFRVSAGLEIVFLAYKEEVTLERYIFILHIPNLVGNLICYLLSVIEDKF